MKQERKVVIVGGGVIGLCIAYYASKAGMQVTVLEREVESGDSCSHGNAGMVVPSHFIPLAAPGMVAKGLRMMLNPESPFYIRPRFDLGLFRWLWLFLRSANQKHVDDSVELLRDLNLESRRLFAELQEEGDFGLVKKGLLMLCKTQKGLDAEAAVAEQARAIGLAAEVVDAHQTAKLDPNIQMNVMGAVYFPEDCHLNPSRLLDQLRARIRAMGGTIEYGQEVLEWQSAAGRVRSVKTAMGEFSADEFVIAGGSWSSSLLSRLGCKIPMQAGKGYSISLENPQELPQLCSIFTEAKVAITPMGNALRFAGTMEVGGLEHKVNEQRVHGILRSIPEYFPAFQVNDFRDCRPWVGLRPVSPDGIPYLGRVPHFSNLTAATGHAMMGVSLAPVTGKMVADLLIGTLTFRNLSAMKIDRFS